MDEKPPGQSDPDPSTDNSEHDTPPCSGRGVCARLRLASIFLSLLVFLPVLSQLFRGRWVFAYPSRARPSDLVGFPECVRGVV